MEDTVTDFARTDHSAIESSAGRQRVWAGAGAPPGPPSPNGPPTTATAIYAKVDVEVREQRIEHMFRAAARYRLDLLGPIVYRDDIGAALQLVARNALVAEGIALRDLDPVLKLGEYLHQYDRPEEQLAIISGAQFIPLEMPAPNLTIERSKVKREEGDEGEQ